MTTWNKILKELKNVPINRLEEVYSLIHSINENVVEDTDRKDKILSFAGSFNELSQTDYDDFVNETKKIRANLFDRELSL
jgi:hypothetical protein